MTDREKTLEMQLSQCTEENKNVHTLNLRLEAENARLIYALTKIRHMSCGILDDCPACTTKEKLGR